MNANYTSSPSASIFHSYCLARRKSWPDKPWGWRELLDRSWDQDAAWSRTTAGARFIGEPLPRAFFAGRSWEGQTRICAGVQEDGVPCSAADSEGAETTSSLQRQLFCWSNTFFSWKMVKIVRKKGDQDPHHTRLHGGVFLSPQSMQGQLLWSPDLCHLCFSWKLTTVTSRLLKYPSAPALGYQQFIFGCVGSWDKLGFSHL